MIPEGVPSPSSVTPSPSHTKISSFRDPPDRLFLFPVFARLEGFLAIVQCGPRAPLSLCHGVSPLCVRNCTPAPAWSLSLCRRSVALPFVTLVFPPPRHARVIPPFLPPVSSWPYLFFVRISFLPLFVGHSGRFLNLIPPTSVVTPSWIQLLKVLVPSGSV